MNEKLDRRQRKKKDTKIAAADGERVQIRIEERLRRGGEGGHGCRGDGAHWDLWAVGLLLLLLLLVLVLVLVWLLADGGLKTFLGEKVDELAGDAGAKERDESTQVGIEMIIIVEIGAAVDKVTRANSQCLNSGVVFDGDGMQHEIAAKRDRFDLKDHGGLRVPVADGVCFRCRVP